MRLETNLTGTDYVVGDIHGRFSSLEKRLEELRFNSDVDRLLCVGDLVDRGLESHRVLEFLEKPWVYSVLGNHELMAVYYYTSPYYKELYSLPTYISKNGNQWFLALGDEEQKIYCDRFMKLPYFIEVGNIAIVHAEAFSTSWDDFKVEVQTDKGCMEQSLWSRHILKDWRDFRKIPAHLSGVDLIIHGHTTLQEPMKLGNRMYIDTDNLTVMSLQECLDFGGKQYGKSTYKLMDDF